MDSRGTWQDHPEHQVFNRSQFGHLGFDAGDRVLVAGIEKHDDPLKKYNGHIGEVVRFDEKMRRWVVKMTNPQTKEPKLIIIRAAHLVDLDRMVKLASDLPIS